MELYHLFWNNRVLLSHILTKVMLKNNPYIYYVLIFFAPLFVFIFNEYNEVLANSDGQHYLDIALMQYQIFEDQGLIAGLESIYNVRSIGLRPLIYPVYITLFMLLTQGDLYLTTSLVMSSIALIWVSVDLFLKEKKFVEMVNL